MAYGLISPTWTCLRGKLVASCSTRRHQPHVPTPAHPNLARQCGRRRRRPVWPHIALRSPGATTLAHRAAGTPMHALSVGPARPSPARLPCLAPHACHPQWWATRELISRLLHCPSPSFSVCIATGSARSTVSLSYNPLNCLLQEYPLWPLLSLHARVFGNGRSGAVAVWWADGTWRRRQPHGRDGEGHAGRRRARVLGAEAAARRVGMGTRQRPHREGRAVARGHVGQAAARGAPDNQLAPVVCPRRLNKPNWHRLDGGVAVGLIS